MGKNKKNNNIVFCDDIWREILSYLIVPFVCFSSIATFSRLSKRHYKMIQECRVLFESILQIKYKNRQSAIGRYDQIKRMIHHEPVSFGKIGQTITFSINDHCTWKQYKITTPLDFLYESGCFEICFGEQWASNFLMLTINIRDQNNKCRFNHSMQCYNSILFFPSTLGSNIDWLAFQKNIKKLLYLEFIFGTEARGAQFENLLITFHPSK